MRKPDPACPEWRLFFRDMAWGAFDWSTSSHYHCTVGCDIFGLSGCIFCDRVRDFASPTRQVLRPTARIGSSTHMGAGTCAGRCSISPGAGGATPAEAATSARKRRTAA